MCAGRLWHLILYADGITPGAVLAPDNRRKAVVWYISFLEFGDRLCCEELWMPVAVARTLCKMAVCGDSVAVSTAYFLGALY